VPDHERILRGGHWILFSHKCLLLWGLVAVLESDEWSDERLIRFDKLPVRPDPRRINLDESLINADGPPVSFDEDLIKPDRPFISPEECPVSLAGGPVKLDGRSVIIVDVA
jgi:hypothetical protein